jgi:hypothetical protein
MGFVAFAMNRLFAAAVAASDAALFVALACVLWWLVA